ncbi:MAG: hypothetical protein K8I29_13770, partial [Alphaproteobacteria bacterium]|nr:hypothetical protein [Candidatus Nitrobium versatile]
MHPWEKTGTMGAATTPTVIPCIFDQPGPYRIGVDVEQTGPQVLFVFDQLRIVTTDPQPTLSHVASVKDTGIPTTQAHHET